MKKVISTVLIVLLPAFIFAQSYIATDSSKVTGVELITGTSIDNAKFCRVKKGEQVIRYTPDQIKEYGFDDGRVYKSFKVKLPDQESAWYFPGFSSPRKVYL